MKMIVLTKGNIGMNFLGDTYKDIVLQMMRKDFITVTKTDYMAEVRDRLRVVYGIHIDFVDGDYEGFVMELIRAGFVEIVA